MKSTTKRKIAQNAVDRAIVNKFADLLYFTVHTLLSTIYVGNPCNNVKDLSQAMDNPKPGDMVCELSSVRIDSFKRIGRFILKRNELIPSSDGDPENDCFEDFWYIELLDGTLFKWYNANIKAIPDEFGWVIYDYIKPNKNTDKYIENSEWAKEAIKRHNIDTP